MRAPRALVRLTRAKTTRGRPAFHDCHTMLMYVLNKKEALRYIADRAKLFDECATDNCFAGSAWLAHLVNQVATSSTRFVVSEHLATGFESTMLLFSPDGRGPLRSLANYYSSLCTPVYTRSSDRKAETGALIRQLRSESCINFAPLSKEVAAELVGELRRNGWYAKEYFRFGNWFLRPDGISFSQYMAGRPPNLRNTWLRKRKRFKGDARIEIITENAGAAIEAFQEVYAKSWKTPEPYPDFVPGWARICDGRKTLRLGIAWVGQTPIAAQIWFVENRRAYIFKLAYDEEFRSWSPGTVVTAALMEHVLDIDRVEEVDFLTGDDDYKKTWMNDRRERVGVLACNLRVPTGAFRAVYESARTIARGYRRRSRTSVGELEPSNGR